MIKKTIQRKSLHGLIALLLCSGLAVAQPTPWVTPSEADVKAMFDKANEALMKGEWASAAGFHRWYHDHSQGYPGQGGVRLSFALAYWRVVAEKYPPALADLRDARDRAATKVRAGGYGLHGAMRDLTAIDGVLGDPRVTADTFAWLHQRRPADARAMAQVALPALLAADQAALALPYIDPDELMRDARSSLDTWTQARYALPNQSAEDRLRSAQESVDKDAAPTVAALVKGGERERAQALVAELRKLLGPDAALTATLAALEGTAPPFGRFGAAIPLLATPPVWTPPDQPDLSDLREQARADMAARRFAQAAAYHRWYHANALRIDPAHSGVRLSFALSDWRALAEVYPSAMLDLRAARDEAAARVRAGGPDTRLAVRDLVALEETLGDPSASAAIALWLQAHRPADLPGFASAALPNLVAAGNAALAVQHFDAKRALGRIDDTFKRLTASPRSDQGPEDARRSAQSFADREAAPAVAAMVQTGQAERARTFIAEVRAVIGADAKLHTCNDALRGFAPPFGRD